MTSQTSELLQSEMLETVCNMSRELDYYRLYLQKFLKETGNDLMGDEEFLTSRANLAGEEYENVRRDGASVALAQEAAMAVLMNGL